MTKTTLVISPFIGIPQKHLSEFENHTKGIGSKLLSKMGYDGHGIRKRRQGIMSPIVATLWFKHEGLVFNGRSENPMTMKIIFMKAKDMPKLACSLGEVVAVSEGGIPLPA
jgi:hypothetical protein